MQLTLRDKLFIYLFDFAVYQSSKEGQKSRHLHTKRKSYSIYAISCHLPFRTYYLKRQTRSSLYEIPRSEQEIKLYTTFL